MHSKYKTVQAGLGQLERQLIDQLARSRRLTIQAADLEKELGYRRAYSNLILSRLCNKGWLQRLRPGIYRLVPLGSDSANPIPEDAWAIAMEIFSPCYISGWTAAEHWDLTEQIFNSTMIFTTQKQRKAEQVIAGLIYKTKYITLKEIFGTTQIWSSNKPVLIANIHRTIIDIMSDPEIGGGGRHVLDIFKSYCENKEASIETLWQYAEKLGNGAVFKRLGFLAEKILPQSPSLLNKFHSKIRTGIINFDPHGPRSGPINTYWGIRLNIPLGDIP